MSPADLAELARTCISLMLLVFTLCVCLVLCSFAWAVIRGKKKTRD